MSEKSLLYVITECLRDKQMATELAQMHRNTAAQSAAAAERYEDDAKAAQERLLAVLVEAGLTAEQWNALLNRKIEWSQP